MNCHKMSPSSPFETLEIKKTHYLVNVYCSKKNIFAISNETRAKNRLERGENAWKICGDSGEPFFCFAEWNFLKESPSFSFSPSFWDTIFHKNECLAYKTMNWIHKELLWGTWLNFKNYKLIYILRNAFRVCTEIKMRF